MALPQDVYRELQDILGEDNITDDPAILCGYQWPIREEHVGTVGGFSPMPSAVALPGSTHEVQAIMKFMEIEQPSFQATFNVGDAVRINDGAFVDFVGSVSEIDETKGKVKVLISIFGRETPVELAFDQVKKL